MLSPGQIERILSTVKQCFNVTSNTEVTMEINPGSVTESKLIEFKSAGVNRASFGRKHLTTRSWLNSDDHIHQRRR
jgi:oxygen-independent coproporphyrinogen-3 oxidase